MENEPWNKLLLNLEGPSETAGAESSKKKRKEKAWRPGREKTGSFSGRNLGGNSMLLKFFKHRQLIDISANWIGKRHVFILGLEIIIYNLQQ